MTDNTKVDVLFAVVLTSLVWLMGLAATTQAAYEVGHKNGQTDAIAGRVHWKWVQYEGWVRAEPPEENR